MASGVAVVTGASAGVGRATAVALARAGFDVALLARGEAGLKGAAEDVRSAGVEALGITTDVADWQQVDAAASRVEDELGPIDVWVNNAMTTVFARSWDMDPAEIKRATEVTYLGQVHGTLAALRRMRPRDNGRIVNVGSALAYVGIPLQAAYCGAKFAARGFFDSVRAELLDEGSHVTISMVHLPGLNTPQFDWSLSRLPKHPQPVPPIYEPEVAAEAIVKTALDGERTRLLGAWNRFVILAAKLAPATLSHYTAMTAIGSQQMSVEPGPDRRANLWAPADDDADHGARGRFSERARGVLSPEFLKNLPATVRNFLRAFARANLRQ